MTQRGICRGLSNCFLNRSSNQSNTMSWPAPHIVAIAMNMYILCRWGETLATTRARVEQLLRLLSSYHANFFNPANYEADHRDYVGLAATH